jgi:general secretion pathway protein L
LAVRQAAKRLRGPAWRPVRWGLAALLGVHLLGINAWAWSQRQAVESRRQAQTALLKAAHPHVRAVLDAPTQMQRETDSLRAAAGRASETDLESMLATAAAAWPDGQGPMQGLKFEPGKLTLTVAGWSEDHVRQFRDRLKPAGWAVDVAPGRVTVLRAGRAG